VAGSVHYSARGTLSLRRLRLLQQIYQGLSLLAWYGSCTEADVTVDDGLRTAAAAGETVHGTARRVAAEQTTKQPAAWLVGWLSVLQPSSVSPTDISRRRRQSLAPPTTNRYRVPSAATSDSSGQRLVFSSAAFVPTGCVVVVQI